MVLKEHVVPSLHNAITAPQSRTISTGLSPVANQVALPPPGKVPSEQPYLQVVALVDAL